MGHTAMLRVASLAVAVAAAACSREGAVGADGLAARGNGGEIALARVAAASASGPAAAAPPSQARPPAPEAAVDEELLVQKALAARLDRDPEVIRALAESRRRILAHAWLDKAIADRARPDAAQVQAFYAGNPALFGARRIYSLRELRVALDGRKGVQALRAVAARGDAARLEEWLSRQNLRFEVREMTEPAEALPLALLARLSTMKDGAIAVVEGEGGPTVVELLRSLPAPLTRSEAAPLIERFLAVRRRLELARAEIERLRRAAGIEYAGGKEAATPAHPAAGSSGARAVDASIETPYDPSTQPGFAASAAPGKDETS